MINIPNHVINTINIKGSDEDVLNLLLMIQHDDIGIGSFDFNKIIPMPSSLNTYGIMKKQRTVLSFGKKQLLMLSIRAEPKLCLSQFSEMI